MVPLSSTVHLLACLLIKLHIMEESYLHLQLPPLSSLTTSLKWTLMQFYLRTHFMHQSLVSTPSEPTLQLHHNCGHLLESFLALQTEYKHVPNLTNEPIYLRLHDRFAKITWSSVQAIMSSFYTQLSTFSSPPADLHSMLFTSQTSSLTQAVFYSPISSHHFAHS